MANSPVMESIFANAQQNAASLIETATLAINAKVNTIEEAEQMIQELSTEAAMFNQLLTTIMNAMRQVESGDMQKEEAAGIIAPAVKELKDKCTALKIANVDAPGDDITEDEIAILRELIIGAKAAAEDRLVAIRLGDDEKTDPEVEAEIEEAEEGFISNFIERRQTAKLNKEKIDNLWASFADKKAETILAQFAKAALPLFDGKDKNHIKSMVHDMIRQDQQSNNDYSGKLSAKDYIVKSFGGVSMAIMPGNVEGFGCHHILAPASDNDGECYFFKKNICSIILNPVNKSEVAPAHEAYEAEVTMEATFLAARYVNNNETKSAKALYSNAKKLYSLGEKNKAIEYMTKAKQIYQRTLTKILNSGKFEKAESVTKTHNGTMRRTITHTDSLSFSIARASIEQKIDKCTAHILMWNNKNNNKSYNELLDTLKHDRENAKAAKKAANESYFESEDNNMEFTYSEVMFAYEAFMDDLEAEMVDEYAMEGIVDSAKEGATAIANKLRSGFAKLRQAIKRGDKKAADEATKEINAASDELDAAANENPGKKGLSRAAKIGLTAAAAAAVAAGMYSFGNSLDKKVASGDITEKDLNKVGGWMRKAARGVNTQVGKAKTFAGTQGEKFDSAIAAHQAKSDEKYYKRQMGKKGIGKATATKLLNKRQEKRANRNAALYSIAHHPVQSVRQGAAAAADKLVTGFGTKGGFKPGNESFSEFDIYDTIMECMLEAMESYESDYDIDFVEESLIDMLDD